MMWFPFICLGSGALLGLIKLPERVSKIIEYIGNTALIILMSAIGINIGANDTVVRSLGTIGLQCAAISLSALFFSVGFVFAVEKTLLSLDRLKEAVLFQQADIPSEVNEINEINAANEDNCEGEQKRSPLVWIIPACIAAGVLTGLLIPQSFLPAIDRIFTGSLAVLYISVGMGLSQNRGIFQYVKLLGWKIILLSPAILLGSLAGGAAAAFLFNIEPPISILAAGGMSYYSITGAFMTQTYGIHAGTYGFLVNVFREFFTVLLLPLLIRISKGAAIAAGAAGNMDTMLVPVSKFVGAELGFVALVTGTILTFTVPVLLPVLSLLLQ